MVDGVERDGPVLADHHDVLEAHAEPPREVDAGLDREGVSHGQDGVVARHEIGVLVLLDPDPVPGAVDEVLAQAGLGDGGARHGVDVLGRDPGSHRVHGGLLRGEQHRVAVAHLGAGLAHRHGAGDVGAVADVVVQRVLATEVAHHGVAWADDALAGLVMRARPVGATAHDGEVDAAVSRRQQPRAEGLGHLDLAAAGQRDLPLLQHGGHTVRGAGRGAQGGDLARRPSRRAAGTSRARPPRSAPPEGPPASASSDCAQARSEIP